MITQKALRLSCLMLVSPAIAAPAPTIEIHHEPGKDIRFSVHDRANGSWRLEVSWDLITWKQQPKDLHVRNSVLPLSHYHIPASQASGKAYYRLASLPSSPVKTTHNTLSSLYTIQANNQTIAAYDYALNATPPAQLANSIARATINNKRATLGRILFYDRRLSLDNSVSCASCHQPEHAFADSISRSTGHRGAATTRNSISLQHVRSYAKGGKFFWDGRTLSLDTAVLDPISHPIEMGLSLDVMVEKIASEPYYRDWFAMAYQSQYPTSRQVSESLSDFIESMVSFRSKYDQGVPVGFSNFTSQEKYGKAIFSAHCGSCHPLGSFSNGGFANNGLELEYADRGRAGLTEFEGDEGMFRIPSLRQVALTAPYMHDGRFATLREVIDFYDHGVVGHPNLTSPLSTTPLGLSESDKLALEAFLTTLTDTSAQENPAFSDPFRTD